MGSKESDTTEWPSTQAPGHVIGSFSSCKCPTSEDLPWRWSIWTSEVMSCKDLRVTPLWPLQFTAVLSYNYIIVILFMATQGIWLAAPYVLHIWSFIPRLLNRKKTNTYYKTHCQELLFRLFLHLFVTRKYKCSEHEAFPILINTNPSDWEVMRNVTGRKWNKPPDMLQKEVN